MSQGPRRSGQKRNYQATFTGRERKGKSLESVALPEKELKEQAAQHAPPQEWFDRNEDVFNEEAE